MAAIMTLGEIESVQRNWTPGVSYNNVQLSRFHFADYAAIYRTQPNMRVCVDFLARNIAQLGLHAFRRISDTDRERLADHPLASLLARPLPEPAKVTRYKLIESLMSDLGIYFNAYWLKLRQGSQLRGLLRVPPQYMTVHGGLLPRKYEMNIGGKMWEFQPDEVAHFYGYNPDNPLVGLAPAETLRRILAEEYEAGRYREGFWANAARMSGFVKRPLAAPEWSDDARERFLADFSELYSGAENSGKTAVLEEGMEWERASFNAQESEYLAGRKLTREECARAYHIPLPMVGILDHATFCLPAHVPVFTEEGPRPIVDVKPGDRVWSHEGSGFVLKRVTRSGQTGVDPILRIKTQNRTLEANPTHPILVRRLLKIPDESVNGWHYEPVHRYVPAGEIERGDILVALKELPDGEPRQSVSRMEFFGLLLGDGNVYPDSGRVSIARAEDAPYMDHYRAIMRAEFESFGARGNGRAREGVPTQPVTLVEGGRQTRFASVLAAEELAELGLSGTARTKRVPGWVFGATREERLAFLRGYLDADGSVDKRGKVSYSSCNPALIEDVRHLCMSMGIPVNNAYHRVGQTTLPTGDIGNVDQWTVTCSNPAANRLIGSHDPRYQTRLATARGWEKKAKAYPFAKGRRSEPPAGCEYSRVVSVEELPAEPVYDIEVEDTHNFIAAGVIVHNSNIKEQHKHLYQDALGPWLAMIEQDIELQVLPEFDDTDGVYLEFNIAEKLAGSFEEQAQSLQTAVGRPWMTANEARARQNLPSLEGGDELVTPLNVLVGGQASLRDSGAQNENLPNEQRGRDSAGAKAFKFDSHAPQLRSQHEAKWTEVLQRHYRRQEAVIASRVPKGRKLDIGGVWFDEQRWNSELHADLLRLNNMTATAWAQQLLETGGLDVGDIDAFEQNMLPWLEEHSRIQAEYLNAQVRNELIVALNDPEPSHAVRNLFLLAIGTWALRQAISAVTAAANFGAHEAANASGLRRKRWRVNSSNPRPEHQAMAGETVGIRERFSNGMRWPGDPAGGAENNANCHCSLEFMT